MSPERIRGREIAGWHIGDAATLEQYVKTALGEHAGDFDVDAINTDFRVAINAALNGEVTLNGNFFFLADSDNDTEYDLEAIVESIDIWAIAARHDNS